MESAVIYNYHCSKEDINALKKIYKYCIYAYYSPLSFECEYMFFNRPQDAQAKVENTITACWASIYPCFREYLKMGEELFKEKFPGIWEIHYKKIIDEFGFLIESGRGYPYWISKLLLSVESKDSRSVHIVNENTLDNGEDNLDWYVREGFISEQQKRDIQKYLKKNDKKIQRILRGVEKPTQIKECLERKKHDTCKI